MTTDINNTSEETAAIIEQFLEHGNSPITKKLGIALIENFGGIDDFLKDYEAVASWGIKGGYGEFVYYNTMVSFYTNHKKQIRKSMELVAEDNGFDSLGDFIWDQSILSKEWSKNEVLEGLYKPVKKCEQELKDILYSFQVQLLGELICQNYKAFLERCEEDQ